MPGSRVAQSMAEDRANRFRGGKKSARDRLFGVDDKDFWRWFHRQEKGRTGAGDDLDATDQARKLYDEWLRLGRPKAK